MHWSAGPNKDAIVSKITKSHRAKWMDVAATFWGRVARAGNDECWEWTAGRFVRGGYGSFKTAGRVVYAHRLAFQLSNGPVPAGQFVLHRCDNPPCCNPSHLFLGSNADNVADREAKGRGARGATSGAARHPESMGGRTRKMTLARARELRALSGSMTRSQLAKHFGIGYMTVRDILVGKTHREEGTRNAQNQD